MNTAIEAIRELLPPLTEPRPTKIDVLSEASLYFKRVQGSPAPPCTPARTRTSAHADYRHKTKKKHTHTHTHPHLVIFSSHQPF